MDVCSSKVDFVSALFVSFILNTQTQRSVRLLDLMIFPAQVANKSVDLFNGTVMSGLLAAILYLANFSCLAFYLVFLVNSVYACDWQALSNLKKTFLSV